MIPSLGRIRKVPLREVWNNEATSFTPWLLGNEDVLSELLGIDISLDRREESVGRYSLDLIGRNNDDGTTVIVENQLENTDHSHLGQLLTYAGGLEAATIIWIASEFRDEHRAALDWLNRVTGEATHFYGVEVSAIQIGDSLPAPDLTLVVEPNDFGKSVKSARDAKWLNERGSKYQEFWQRFIDEAQESFPELKSRKAPTRQYMGLPIGVSGCYRTVSFGRSHLKVELYFGSPAPETNSARLDVLYEHKREIEEIFGDELSWEELEGKKATRVAFYRDASILSVGDWTDYLQWTITNFGNLTRVTEADLFKSAMATLE